MFDKEKYLYDRREWSKSNAIGLVIVGVFLMVLFSHIGREEARGGYRVSLLVFLFLFSIYHCSLRVAITDSKMIFHEGFFPILRRSIFFDEIEDIAFKNTKKYDHLVRKRRDCFSTGDGGVSTMVFKLRDNKAFGIIGSGCFMQEILAVIRKTQPHIKID